MTTALNPALIVPASQSTITPFGEWKPAYSPDSSSGRKVLESRGYRNARGSSGGVRRFAIGSPFTYDLTDQDHDHQGAFLNLVGTM